MFTSEWQKKDHELVVGWLITSLDGHLMQSGKVIAYIVHRLL